MKTMRQLHILPLLTILLILSVVPAYGQEGSTYYNEFLRHYMNSPVIGNGHYGYFKGRVGMFNESDLGENSIFLTDLRLGGFLDFDYVGLFAEAFCRGYAGSSGGIGSLSGSFARTGSYDQHNGLDSANTISWYHYMFHGSSNAFFSSSNNGAVVSLVNYYIQVADIHPLIPDIRIGKLWTDYGPYTLYRTFGLEGIQLSQTFPYRFAFRSGARLSFSYDMVYSYNKVTDHVEVEHDEYPTNFYNRHLFAGKYQIKVTGWNTLLTFQNLNYRVNGKDFQNDVIRTESMYNLSLRQQLPAYFLLRGIYAWERHNENLLGLSFDNTYFYKIDIDNVNGVLDGGIGFRTTSPDFMPRDPVTRNRLAPFNTGYGYIQDEERENYDNEKAVYGWLRKSIQGVAFTLRYEYSDFLDPDNVQPWRLELPPRHYIKTEAFYSLHGLEIRTRLHFYKAAAASSDGSHTLKGLSGLETDLFTYWDKAELNASHMLYQNRFEDGTMTFINQFYLKLGYNVSKNIRLIGEARTSLPGQDEPSWMHIEKDYMDQSSWGQDNFVKLMIEFFI